MASKKKSKKQKKPNIPVQSLARPRLEQILNRRRQAELDDEEYVTSIKALMSEIGHESVLNALVGLLDNADNEQKDALMVAIPKLGNAQTIKHLWQLVRRSKLSVGGKMTALIILKQMGEDVNLEDPGEYFSWRDIKQADISEVANMGRFSMRAIIKEIQQAESSDEVEAMMLHFDRILGQTGGEATSQAMIDELVEMGDSGAADMLTALAATTPQPKVREAARRGLLKLAGQKVFPQSAIAKSLLEERFYAAYSTDPANPWQQGVILGFERARNAIQYMVFLLDFGHPWHGAIKDMFVTHTMTPQQFEREFINKSRHEAEYRQVTYARARQFMLDALEANRKNRVKLPPEYYEFRHLMERRIVDPSPETLAYAEQVDAQTVDEWGELAGEPLRGIEIISPGGESMPLMFMDELDDEDEEELEFEALLDEVDDYYFPAEDEDEDEDEDEEEELALPYDWAVDYLTARYNEEVEVAELDERWEDLCDFLFYLDENDEAPPILADIHGYHLSEFITDFWDDEIEDETPLEMKRHVIETIQDLYAYLAAQGHVVNASAQRVAEAAATLLSRPDKLTPIPR